MFTGYCGVIATIWSIQDEDAPVIVDHVIYSELFSGTEPNSTDAARALHRAVGFLLRQVGDYFCPPFIHVGIWVFFFPHRADLSAAIQYLEQSSPGKLWPDVQVLSVMLFPRNNC